MPVVNVNSVDPDQKPRSEVSDLGLHCLPMSHFNPSTVVRCTDPTNCLKLLQFGPDTDFVTRGITLEVLCQIFSHDIIVMMSKPIKFSDTPPDLEAMTGTGISYKFLSPKP